MARRGKAQAPRHKAQLARKERRECAAQPLGNGSSLSPAWPGMVELAWVEGLCVFMARSAAGAGCGLGARLGARVVFFWFE